jgi:hypothetical protein
VLHAFKRQNKWLFQPTTGANGSAKEEGNKVVPDGISGKLKTYIDLKKQLGGIVLKQKSRNRKRMPRITRICTDTLHIK